MRKLGCSVCASTKNDILENLKLLKNAGFDTTFLPWDDGMEIGEYIALADSLGLEIESLLAPIANVNTIWEVGNDGDAYTEKIRRCIKTASKYNIPIVVLNSTDGAVIPQTSPIGLMRYKKLIIEAERGNVKLAFENNEMVHNFALVLHYFKNDTVCFCYDCGHESCFTPGFRFMKLFGDRTICTRIHDNFGLGESKEVHSRDDLHHIPFECGIDFNRVCEDIKESGYSGSLMLNVKYRDGNGQTPEAFFKKAYESALKLRNMIDGGENDE